MEQPQETRKQYHKMMEMPIPKLVASLAAPAVLSMLVTSAYNLTDTFFVSQLGTSATGAVGVAYAVLAIIQAIGYTLGLGSASVISRLLGEKKSEEAGHTAAAGFYSSLLLGAVITAAGLLFNEGIMRLLGATETILPLAVEYAVYIFWSAPLMCASFVLGCLLRAGGKAVLSMVGLCLGGVVNIALDPLFIFTFKMGISGAALATLVSQAASFAVLLFPFFRRSSMLHLNPKAVFRRGKVYGAVLKAGMPSFCRQGFASVSTAFLNGSARAYGDAAVAAMSVVGRISLLVISLMIGLGQGFQPVIGYNYGGKQYGRVRKAFWFSLIVGTVLLAVLGAVCFFFAPQLMTLFRADDAGVIETGSFALRAQCVLFPLQPLIVLSNMLFQAVERPWQASVLSSARQGLFFLPLILILPGMLGLLGVQLVQPVADILTAVLCVPFLIVFFRGAKRRGAGPEGPAGHTGRES